ncbi:hypothetical protein F0L68_40455 [Solihabitans fulvus]|uniref:Uncharacterized protein n=1 Tax=Solihabitans fulvus TaxID=1892852 RepID=A0A5B2WA00_9PSEU|nr:hypothetical protein [Solihabitans fulvus]KAA2247019.1 hypothetical protein F0L68_40455 [Solihabitans fulvus]
MKDTVLPRGVRSTKKILTGEFARRFRPSSETGFAGAENPDLAEVLAAEAAEISRQEGRADTKAIQVGALAGTLATVAAAAIGVVLSHAVGWPALAITGLLAAAAASWIAAVAVLLRRVIRPQLGAATRGTFVSGRQTDELDGMTLISYHRARIDRQGPLVLARYQHLRRAVDLLLYGFVPLGAGVLAATLTAALT